MTSLESAITSPRRSVCATLQKLGLPRTSPDILPPLGKKLGEGAFGEVFASSIDVAIKKIPISSDILFNQDKVTELVNETTALKHLQVDCSQYVVKTYDILLDTECNTLYIVMEQLSGDLYDISSKNILIGTGGSFKFADFGLSCVLDGGRDCTGLKGSPDYLLPEMLVQKCPKGSCSHTSSTMKAADYWALGMTFINMLMYYVLVYSGISSINASYWTVTHRQKSRVPYAPYLDEPGKATHFESNVQELFQFIIASRNESKNVSVESAFQAFDYVYGKRLAEIHFGPDGGDTDTFEIMGLYGDFLGEQTEAFFTSIDSTLDST